MSRALRVGIGAPYDLGRAGGVNSHIRAQARALAARGHDVCVFGAASAPLGRGEVALSGCATLVIGGTETGFGVDPRSWRRLRDLLRARRFDVVHLHEPLMPLVPWFALLQADAPIVATFHAHREQGHWFYAPFRPMLAPLMRRVAYRIAVSEAARRTVAPHFPGQYEIVPNGIDVEAFREPRPRPAAFAADRRHVLFVGRLEPRKGLDHLVRAMARVQERASDARLIVVGEGPDRAPLEALARAAGADVAFAGRVADEDLPAYFQQADLVCASATGGESFGIVLLEAMAAATPIVATRIDGYASLVGNPACARLVPPGDAEALAAALSQLMGDEPARRALAARGAARAASFDWRAIAAQLESIYGDLIRHRADAS